ncbi:DUF1722 domain-containing protein [Desulfospira joergensenii]|uniref:DUF1722 domain-containing protein n=1 Tax=Desulfospira joergensenii TaxID=53329 RepID=UPI0003B691A4|nr:DUF1722 domain-containing protein [Desulfospira joergensenii]
MRIWDIDPGFLNDQSLLGEHRELHGLVSIHVNQKKGYSRHPETLRWTKALTGLYLRHEILVQEMGLRGFRHNSPIERPGEGLAWPDTFIDPPHDQFSLLGVKYRDRPMGRIPLPGNICDLWTASKYSVMARDPEQYRDIGPRVASGSISFELLSRTLVTLMRTPPSRGRLINALDHMWGYVSDKSRADRKDLGLSELLKEIRVQTRANRIDYLARSTALGELGAWIP